MLTISAWGLGIALLLVAVVLPLAWAWTLLTILIAKRAWGVMLLIGLAIVASLLIL